MYLSTLKNKFHLKSLLPYLLSCINVYFLLKYSKISLPNNNLQLLIGHLKVFPGQSFFQVGLGWKTGGSWSDEPPQLSPLGVKRPYLNSKFPLADEAFPVHPMEEVHFSCQELVLSVIIQICRKKQNKPVSFNHLFVLFMASISRFMWRRLSSLTTLWFCLYSFAFDYLVCLFRWDSV